MKKLFLGAAVAVSSLTFAQQFGAKAGMNVSSLSKQASLEDQGSKIGFYAGVFMNTPVAENFSIQPEVLYSQYGAKYDQTIAGTRYSWAAHHDYITLPVMFQYNVIPNLYLEAGPEFGFLVSAKTKTKNESDNDVLGTSDDYKDDMKTFNFGLGLGAGYYFTDNIGLTARYIAGLSDINKNKLTGDDKRRNNVFQVGLAFKF